MTRRTFLTRIAAWLGITHEPIAPPERFTCDFDDCAFCKMMNEARR